MFTKKWKNVLVAVCALTLSVSSVIGGLTLNKVQADDVQPTVVNPIAKYDFADENDLGKDLMGNYNLATTGEVSKGTNGALFAGGAIYAANEESDISETIGSYTLNFTMTPGANVPNRAQVIGFGWNDWGASKWNWLTIGQNADGGSVYTCRYSSHGTTDGTTGRDWGKEVMVATPGTTYQVTISFEVGGKANLWIDGVNKYSYDVNADWSMSDGNTRFAIGNDCTWGNQYSAFHGEVGAVSIYDFAMSEAEMTTYWKNGQLTTADVDKAKTAVADYSSTIIVEETATDEEIIKLAPARSSIDVTMQSGATRKGLVNWTGVEVVDGQKMLVGNLTSVYNPDGVKAYGKIALIAETKTLAPIAKYDFADENNLGKDSMGNYDLHVMGYPTKNDIGVHFDGTSMLYLNEEDDFSNDIKAFTLAFDVKADGVQGSEYWCTPIGFGLDNWISTKWMWFQYAGEDDLLRFTAGADMGKSDAYWGYEIQKGTAASVCSVVLTVQPGGKVTVYANGAQKLSVDCPADYDLNSAMQRFSIGGAAIWDEGRPMNFVGSVGNVAIYDFAMTADQVNVYENNGELKTNSLLTESWIESVDTTLTFAEDKVVTAELYEAMSSDEKVSLMGNATVVATLSNLAAQKSQINLPIVWTAVEEVEGKWMAQGYVQNVGNSLAAISTARIKVTQEVPVTPSYEITNGEMENGTLEAEKTWGLEGDNVLVAVKPATHYVLDKVYANGQEVAANENGEYVITVGTEDIVLTATFVPYQYSITAGEMENGTVEFSAEKAGIDTVITITPVPAKYYVATNVYVNGEEIAPDGAVYTFKVAGDAVVTATFAEAIYSVDAYVRGENGTVDVGGITSSKGGETLVINVTPAEGYVVDYVEVNGQAIEAVEGVYSIIIETDTEIEVRFKEYVEEPEQPEQPENPEQPGDSEQTSTSEGNVQSCKGAIGSGSMLSLILLAGASIVLFKKKD
ncbi:MAG: hypothetical protein IJW13_05895 [Clostridia bacterium]|nr:hypothetical protein [Clostridia bacterium]